MHPVEEAQAKLQESLPDDLDVLGAVSAVLGLDDRRVARELVVRQLAEADRHVNRYVNLMAGSVRRAGIGVGFIAGVMFAEAVRLVQGQEHAPVDAALAERLFEIAGDLETRDLGDLAAECEQVRAAAARLAEIAMREGA